jgi:hypothetical protein
MLVISSSTLDLGSLSFQHEIEILKNRFLGPNTQEISLNNHKGYKAGNKWIPFFFIALFINYYLPF